MNFIRDNIQVNNEDPINGNISIPNTEELKRRYMGAYGAQGRAVTKQDYVTALYSMPAIYGSVKRASVARDTNDLRRNLNIYMIAEGADNKLQKPTVLLKQNALIVLTYLTQISSILQSTLKWF
jgi:hypothetical protein